MLYIPVQDGKVCRRCNHWHPLGKLIRYRTKPTVGFAGECKPCGNARIAKWHADHRDRVHEISKKYYETHKDEIRRKRPIWLARYMADPKNREKKRAINNEYMRTYNLTKGTRWKRQKITGNLKLKDIRLQIKRQKSRCYYCNCKLDKHYHIDHVVPLSRGGLNHIDNIVIACAKCNLTKNAKMPHEWSKGGRLL